MIGKNLQDNLDIKVNSKKMEKLKDDFPEFFTKDGDFKLDSFKDFLKEEEVELTKEAYELNFLGKSYAKYQSSLNTETYISPDAEHNEKPENKDSENVYIVGDNIDALKHLLGSYSGKIKCIYIDPPYNTGSDGFVYPDSFKFTAEEIAEKIGITEEEADRILNLEGKSSHAAWLTFMYPRLLLARDLLADDGVIFISIDDNEQANLKLMCDEIFGEDKKLVDGAVIVKTEGRRYGGFAKTHDYFLGYAKNKESVELNEIDVDGKKFKYSDKYGDFNIQDLRNQNASAFNSENRPNLRYPFYVDVSNTDDNGFSDVSLIPIDGWEEVYPIVTNGKESVWRWGRGENEKAQKQIHNICARRGPDGTIRVFEKMRTITEKPKTVLINKNYLTNTGTKEVDSLIGKDIFEFPKPLEFIKLFSKIGSDRHSLILDFFSGSATTADAVMQLNAEDGGNRKYILVQLPETIPTNKPAYKAGYRTVDEIGRDRIERAAAKIKDETKADIDYGYKLFYLEKPSEKTLLDLEEFKPEIKLVSDDMISVFDNKHASGKENILATWLNEDGYGLTKEVQDYKLENYTAQLIEKTLYIIDEGLESDDVMKLIKQIEDDSLDITRLVIYSYSVKFSVLNELRKNIKVLKNNKNVTLIERF